MKRRANFKILYVICFALILSCQQEKDPIVLENALVRFEFDPYNSGLCAIIDQRDQFNFIRRKDTQCKMWELSFVKGGERVRLSNLDVELNNEEVSLLNDGSKVLTFSWEQISTQSFELNSNILVQVKLPASSGLAEWKISVDNHSEEWSVKEVDFPKFNNFLADGAFDVAGCFEDINPWGTLLKNFQGRIEKKKVYDDQNIPMEFISVIQGVNSLYLGIHDEGKKNKKITLETGKEFSIQTLADSVNTAGNDYNVSWPVVIGVYRGGWMDAAKIYRKFASRAPWIKSITKSTNPIINEEPAICLCENEETVRSEKYLEEIDKAKSFFNIPLEVYSRKVSSIDQSVAIQKQNNSKSIPLFQAVYTGLRTQRPNKIEMLTLGHDQFQNMVGRDLLFGCVPGRVGIEIMNKEYQNKKNWLLKIGKARQAGNPFFVNGELVDLIDNGRFPNSGEMPEVMGSVWKLDDGTLNLVVMNFTPEQKEFAIRLNPIRYGMIDDKFDINLIYADEDGISTLDDIVGSEVLNPYEIRIFKAKQI